MRQAAAMANLLFTAWRMDERPGAYAVGASAVGLATVALSWGLVWGCHLGIWGLIAGGALPNLALVLALRGTGLRTPFPPGLASYALRMSPARVVGELNTQIDRVLIGLLLGKEQLGLYDLALRTAGVVALVAGSLKNALLPQALRLTAQGAPHAAIERPLLAGYLACAAGAGGTLALGALLVWLNPARPWAAAGAYLPGALLLQLWWVVPQANAITMYARRLNALQSIYAFAMLVVSAAALSVGARWGLLGAQAGLLAANAALPFAIHLALRRYDTAHHRALWLAAGISGGGFALAFASSTVQAAAGAAIALAAGLAFLRRRRWLTEA
jgi:O-antigen/teichoic acid export membrane protein